MSNQIVACFLAVLFSTTAFASWWPWNSGSTNPLPAARRPAGAPVFSPEVRSQVMELHFNLMALQQATSATGFKLSGDDLFWARELSEKVIPQLNDDALTIAIAGGTNIGKSTIFNHIAQATVSQVSHSAAATKHSVMLLSPNRAKDLEGMLKLFDGLRLMPDGSAAAAVEEDPDGAHRLIYRTSKGVPDDIRVIDTADIDSVNMGNWEKAAQIGRVSDLVVAVITKQKYKDKAVVDFFRRMGESGKPAIVVVNELSPHQLESGQWRDWISEFSKETGIVPFRTFLCPEQAEVTEAKNWAALQFHEVLEGRVQEKNAHCLRNAVRDLEVQRLKAEVLADTIVRALEGGEAGLGALPYLQKVGLRCSKYSDLKCRIEDVVAGKKCKWPCVPTQMFTDSLKDWWVHYQRSDVGKAVNAVQRVAGAPVRFLGKFVYRGIWGDPPSPTDEYIKQQKIAIETIVAQLFEVLGELNSGRVATTPEELQEMLSPAALRQISPTQQLAIVNALNSVMTSYDLKSDLEVVMHDRLNRWAAENPTTLAAFKQIDLTANAALCATFTTVFSGTMAALTTGAPSMVAGLQALAQGSLTSPAGVSTLTTGSAGAAMGEATASRIGDFVIPSAFSEVVMKVQAEYLQRFNDAIRQHLGVTLSELERGAKLGVSKEFLDANRCANGLLVSLRR